MKVYGGLAVMIVVIAVTALETNVVSGQTVTDSNPPAVTGTAGNPPAATATAGNPPAATATAGNPPAATATAGNPPAVTGTAGNPPAVTGTAGNPPAVTGTAGNPPAVTGTGGTQAGGGNNPTTAKPGDGVGNDSGANAIHPTYLFGLVSASVGFVLTVM